MNYCIPFDQIDLKSVPEVGGKNASLGELYQNLIPKGIMVPNGFATTANAYREFIYKNKIEGPLAEILGELDTNEFSNLSYVGQTARELFLNTHFPGSIKQSILSAFHDLERSIGPGLRVAVRSSATAEDLPTASFAGRMESYLNIGGEEQLLEAVRLCYGSLFTDRAIKYRFDMGFHKLPVAISVGVQQMVRSDKASSGVAFTIDPDSGFQNSIIINSSWGLGENVVQGRVTPDEWIVFKPTLFSDSFNPVLKSQCGAKENTMVYVDNSESLEADKTIVILVTPDELQKEFSLSHSEVVKLARWCFQIEKHYGYPMDIEWAKDGVNNQLYIVQARPETVHTKGFAQVRQIFSLKERGKVLAKGIALGDKISAGKARVIFDPRDGDHLQKGEILVTDITNPDWDPILKRSGGIVTDKGGRTSHAAIVAREMGTVAVVGCGNATKAIENGKDITVSCAEGKEGYVYEGRLNFEVTEQDFSHLPVPATSPMLILADPDRAFELCNYPNKGVGLMRLEFVIANSIKIHPLALVEPEKVQDLEVLARINEMTKEYDDGENYFIDKLAGAVATVSAAFYPKDVIVRLSDFKSNEYGNLIGGKYFEPHEENPMIGLRGASRYYSDFYKKGFALECKAMKKVRDELGMTNVKLMVPFCRTLEEGRKVIAEMAVNGLRQKDNGLEIYMMVEIPSNVVLANEFAKLFDGFSIGSNDLTQLILGIDRDSALVSNLFDEENPAVMKLIQETIHAAKQNHIKVGLCGQAASDIPDFAKFLVREGIDSISFNLDALLRGIENIVDAEQELLGSGVQ